MYSGWASYPLLIISFDGVGLLAFLVRKIVEKVDTFDILGAMVMIWELNEINRLSDY